MTLSAHPADELAAGLVRHSMELAGGNQEALADLPAGVRLGDRHAVRLVDSLSPAQRQLLYAYSEVAARVDPRCKPARDLARTALGIEPRFAALVERLRIQQPHLPTSVAEAYLLPAPELVDQLSRIVRRYHVLSLPLGQRALTGLAPAVYEHEEDRMALDALRVLPGIDRLISFMTDRFARGNLLRLMATGIEVTESSMPELHRLHLKACETLVMSEPPPLMVIPGAINAYTMGHERPIVAISQAAVGLLNQEEILFVLGHELGHIRSQHVLYQQMAAMLGELASFIPFGAALNQLTVGMALEFWSRRAELTADRAGLLACQSPEAALSCMAKFAGLPPSAFADYDPRDFLEQALRLDAMLDENAMDRIGHALGTAMQSHPYPVRRAAALASWLRTGAFHDILEATPEQRAHISKIVGDDPLVPALLVEVAAATSQWAAAKFQMDPLQAQRDMRRMLCFGVHPNSPLSSIFMVDLELRWTSGDAVHAVAHLLVLEGEQPRRISLELAKSRSWSRMPKEFREQAIRRGNRNLTYPVYRRAEQN